MTRLDELLFLARNNEFPTIDGGGTDLPIEISDVTGLQTKLDEIDEIKNDQYKIKASTNDTSASYLDGKIDGVTIEVVSDKLVVKNLNGLTIGVSDINAWLSGTSSNIQNQINTINTSITTLVSGMEFKGKINTKAELEAITTRENGDLYVVLVDESLSGGRSMYVYSDTLTDWEFIGEFVFSDSFIELTDTPSSYAGQDGKVIKVDETNNKIVFSNIDWSEIQNKPTSSIVDIDISVSEKHTHPNKESLDKLSEDTNGKALYGGIPIAETIDSLVSTSANIALSANQGRVLDNKVTLVDGRLNAHMIESASSAVRPHGMGSIASQEFYRGVWSPYLKGEVTEGNFSVLNRVANYTRIANTVFCTFRLVGNLTGATGRLCLNGLPISPNNNADVSGFLNYQNLNTGTVTLQNLGTPNNVMFTSGGIEMVSSEVLPNPVTVYGSFSYTID